VRTIDTPVLEVMLGLVVEVGVVQHSLGGDASNVQTCSSEGSSLLNTGGLENTSNPGSPANFGEADLETELGSLNGGHVSTRT